MKVIIYSKEGCQYCDHAVELCETEGLDYEKVMIDKEKLKEICGGPVTTYPQIFIDGRRIGTYFEFQDYIEEIDIDMLDVKEQRLEKLQEKSLKETAWMQLIFTLKFWMDDTSPSFEKTDLFIEKSINTTFDVLNIAPVKSVIDLGKFLFKEKFKMN